MPSKKLVMYRAGATVASVLPAEAARGLARGLGGVLGWLPDLDGRRAVVASHMARVLGRPLSRTEARRMVAEVFAFYGRYWAESLRLPTMPQWRVAAGVGTVGFDHVEDALAAGKGAIIAAPHLGGWEWGAMWLVGIGLPVTVAVEPLDPPDLFEWFARFRERLGMHVVPVGPGAAAAVLQALKNNHIVCLLSDRLVGQASGMEVCFFGERVMLPAGPVTLAIRSGAPLMAAAIYYGETASSHTIVFRPPIELSSTTPFRETVQSGTQAVATELEQLIRRAPTQWHLLQPNWPGDPQLRTPWPLGRGASRSDHGSGAPAGDPAAGDPASAIRMRSGPVCA
jgi:phosphatidylinositol dimannoside acyltransferase